MTDTLLAPHVTGLPFTVGPLREGLAFGAKVEGLTLKDLDRQDVRQALFDLWIDKGVIHFRADDTAAMQVALSACFGALERHMFEESWVAGCPELVNIKFYPEDGTLLSVGPSAILANAPHPNAARLFLEWLLSAEYAEACAEFYQEPVRADAPPMRGGKRLSEIKTINVSAAEIAKNLPEAVEQWRDTFGN